MLSLTSREIVEAGRPRRSATARIDSPPTSSWAICSRSTRLRWWPVTGSTSEGGSDLLQGDFRDAAIVYTSDHGLSLLDHDNVLTHCNSADPHQFEALVPLLALSGDPELQGRLVQAAVRNLTCGVRAA